MKRKLLIVILFLLVLCSSCGLVDGLKKQVKDNIIGNKTEQEVEVEKEFQDRKVEVSYVSVLSKGLNVRKAPDVEAKVLVRVKQEDKFMVGQEDIELDSWKRKWYKIEYEEGKFGYIAGWLVAETRIEILIKEDSEEILAIEVKPVPTYLENPIKPSKVSVNSEYYGMVLKEKKEKDDHKELIFKGELELIGSLSRIKDPLSQEEKYYFKPNEASAVLLARDNNKFDGVGFIIDNSQEIEKDINLEGQHTVLLSDYIMVYDNENIPNYAKIISIK